MSPARRSARRRDWPRGLYEKRPGYFIWRHPYTGEEFVIGRASLAHARNEALAANSHVSAEVPSLVARISGETHTMAQLVADMPTAEKRQTRNTFRALDKIITDGALKGEERIKGLGAIQTGQLTVKHCADLLEIMVKAGKGHQALAVRTRLIAICAHGAQKGWMERNPAEVTAKPKTTVARGRLSLEDFLAIREASREWPWLARAMNLALVTGQDRSTIAAARRKDVVNRRLITHRSKTADKAPPLAIPIDIRLDVLGLSLEDILRERTGIVSHHIIHHTHQQGRAKRGDPVSLKSITNCFTEARKRAGIPDELPDGKGAPTFHEIRSLSKRLYDAQAAAGGMKVDTKELLGHMTDAMSELYKKTRDQTPIEVKVAK
jgi:hypothetical protein